MPRLTIALLLAAGALFLGPAAAGWLVYDRELVLAGQLWRLATGHLVHFSVSHLALDAVAFGVAGWMIERRPGGTRRLALLCLAAALGIGLALLVVLPSLELFGGLSGLAYAAIASAALAELRDETLRPLAITALVAIAAKLTFELATGRMAFVDAGDASIIPVPLSHAVGALAGLASMTKGKRDASG